MVQRSTRGRRGGFSKGFYLSRGRVMGAIGVIIILVAAGILLGMYWDTWFAREVPRDPALGIDPYATIWTGADIAGLDTDPGENKMTIPGYPKLNIQADSLQSTLSLLNPKHNSCYFVFEIILSETQEILYTSGMVPPGEATTRQNLSRALPAGEYDGILKISTASLEDQSPMNGAQQKVKIIAQ